MEKSHHERTMETLGGSIPNDGLEQGPEESKGSREKEGSNEATRDTRQKFIPGKVPDPSGCILARP